MDELTHQQAMDMVSNPDPKVRLKLASLGNVPPEILYYLASDTDLSVRKTVAANEAAPRQTDILLAKDNDSEVRQTLASKIVNFPSSKDALEVLAEDQMVVVRKALSDALKDVPDAPSDIVMTLAMDTVFDVAAPILEFSPVLTNCGLSSISQRSSVSESVSDAIVETNDLEAIGVLLGNASAQIKEETLDDLVERAPGIELWHAPLVGRPTISANAAGKMALFLADNLLKVLDERSDLPAETLETFKLAVHDRLEKAGIAEDEEGIVNSTGQNFLNSPLPKDDVMMLYKSYALDAHLVGEALKKWDYVFVYTALGVLSEIGFKVCKIIFEQNNAKGIVSVCWEAGLPIGLTVRIQQKMAKIAPSELLTADDEGGYPIGVDDMTWCLDFFKVIASKT